MVNVPRIHCHSAFKHYEIFHSNYGSSYGNSVFNTTYNFNGGAMCGGGFWGGLLGGLGMGLGAGIMNFLGGGLFGGGLFGGGMSMFGGGFPMMSWWGLGGSQRDGVGGRNTNTNTTTTTERVVEKEITDRDVAVLKDLEKEIQTLEQKGKDGTLTQTEIDTLKKKVEEESAKSDKYHKTEHDEHYQLLLKRLNDLNPIDEIVEHPEDNRDDAINVALQFARHDGQKIKDADIKGSIIGVKMAADGKTPAGYIIDCKSDSDSKYKLQYEVTINNGIYNIRCISRTHSAEDCQKDLYTPADGINFKKEGNLLVRVTDSDEPLVSEHQKEGYNQVIEYSDDEEDFDLPEGYDEVDDNGEAEIDGKKVKVQV